MYVPEVFALRDSEAIAAVLRDHGFAVLVTPGEAAPTASHLPFLFDPARGGHGVLRAHMARANPQWHALERLQAEGGEALVVFQGPHAYVSPRWYGDGPAVPTWNYLAVHVYGRPRLIEEPAALRALLADLVAVQETGAAEPWTLETQSESYLARMMRGIVGFEIEVTRIDAKAKVNQNKTPAARRGAARGLRETGEPMAAAVAELVERASDEVA